MKSKLAMSTRNKQKEKAHKITEEFRQRNSPDLPFALVGDGWTHSIVDYWKAWKNIEIEPFFDVACVLECRCGWFAIGEGWADAGSAMDSHIECDGKVIRDGPRGWEWIKKA